mmetsp:Transcript_23486/g.24119  ORF Transcript_23486/g.24119 Transcript_23486/m.24119 type:complete len:128 (-) Transcript_23486:107-490(-)
MGGSQSSLKFLNQRSQEEVIGFGVGGVERGGGRQLSNKITPCNTSNHVLTSNILHTTLTTSSTTTLNSKSRNNNNNISPYFSSKKQIQQIQGQEEFEQGQRDFIPSTETHSSSMERQYATLENSLEL